MNKPFNCSMELKLNKFGMNAEKFSLRIQIPQAAENMGIPPLMGVFDSCVFLENTPENEKYAILDNLLTMAFSSLRDQIKFSFISTKS